MNINIRKYELWNFFSSICQIFKIFKYYFFYSKI